MATLPAHLSVANEAPIKDLRCCEDVVADEGSPDSELYPTPAPVANHVAETQRRKSNPCVRGVAPPLVEGCMGGHHEPARPPDADRAGRLGGVRARTDPRQDGRGQEAGQKRGVRFGRPRKLTPHQRKEALQRLAAGETQADIARSYAVDATTIGRLSA